MLNKVVYRPIVISLRRQRWWPSCGAE